MNDISLRVVAKQSQLYKQASARHTAGHLLTLSLTARLHKPRLDKYMLCFCMQVTAPACHHSKPSQAERAHTCRFQTSASNSVAPKASLYFTVSSQAALVSSLGRGFRRDPCESQCLQHLNAADLGKPCKSRHSRHSCLCSSEASLVADKQLVFRSATSTEDLKQAAALRAEAYYEVPLLSSGCDFVWHLIRSHTSTLVYRPASASAVRCKKVLC